MKRIFAPLAIVLMCGLVLSPMHVAIAQDDTLTTSDTPPATDPAATPPEETTPPADTPPATDPAATPPEEATPPADGPAVVPPADDPAPVPQDETPPVTEDTVIEPVVVPVAGAAALTVVVQNTPATDLTPQTIVIKEKGFNLVLTQVGDDSSGKFKIHLNGVNAKGTFTETNNHFVVDVKVNGQWVHQEFDIVDGQVVGLEGCMYCGGSGNTGMFNGLGNASGTSGNNNVGLLNGNCNGGENDGNGNVGAGNGNCNGIGNTGVGNGSFDGNGNVGDGNGNQNGNHNNGDMNGSYDGNGNVGNLNGNFNGNNNFGAGHGNFQGNGSGGGWEGFAPRYTDWSMDQCLFFWKKKNIPHAEISLKLWFLAPERCRWWWEPRNPLYYPGLLPKELAKKYLLPGVL